MSKSPGHQKWPDHKVLEASLPQNVKVDVAGETVAESRNVIEVNEDRHPVRFYFPRSDIRMEYLDPSDTTTQCPFKGTARYFHLNLGGRKFADAAWSYEAPYEEHKALQERIAFYDEKFPDIHIDRSG